MIGRSLIVGKPLALLLSNLNATVTLCHSQTENIELFTQKTDIIVTAVGKEKFLTQNHLSTDKEQIIIDVGINRRRLSADGAMDNEICGDVDFEKVSPLS